MRRRGTRPCTCQRAGPWVIVDAGAETGADGIPPDIPGDEVGRVVGSEGMIKRFLLPELLPGTLFVGEASLAFQVR